MRAAGEAILNQLRRREYTNLDVKTKVHISGLKHWSKNYELAFFAHAFVSRVSLTIPNAELADSIFLIEMALFCDESSWIDGRVAPSEYSQYVHKAWCRMLKFLSDQKPENNEKLMDLVIATSKHLEKAAVNEDEDNLKIMSSQSSTNLARLAYKHLKREDGKYDDDVYFHLHELAFKFAVLDRSEASIVSMCKHAKTLAFRYVKAGKTDSLLLLSNCGDAFWIICQQFDSVEKNLKCFTAIFELLRNWLSLLLDNASVWKVDSLIVVRKWEQFAPCLISQPDLRQLWDCIFHAFKLTVYYHFLEKVNEESKKVMLDAFNRCQDFLRNNNNPDYDEIISKSFSFMWDSMKKTIDTSLEQMGSQTFAIYCAQIGVLLLEYMTREISKVKTCNDETLQVLKQYFSLFDYRLKHLLDNDEKARIEKYIEVLSRVVTKFGKAFQTFGIENYEQQFAHFVCRTSFVLLGNKLYEQGALVCSLARDRINISSVETFKKYFQPFARDYAKSLNELQRHENALEVIAGVFSAGCED